MTNFPRPRRRPEHPQGATTPEAAREKSHPRYARIMQLFAELDDDGTHAAAEEARQNIVRWLAARWRGPLPKAAWQGESFAASKPGHYAGGIAFEADGLRRWALRYDHPDTEVAGRAWSAEAVLVVSGERTTVNVRLSCMACGGHEDALSVPGFVRQLEASPGLFDGEFSIDAQPWLLKDTDDVGVL